MQVKISLNKSNALVAFTSVPSDFTCQRDVEYLVLAYSLDWTTDLMCSAYTLVLAFRLRRS